MKPKEALALAARITAGLVLAAAGIHKAATPAAEFAAVVEAYNILPDYLTIPFAAALPWIEAMAGTALATGYLTRAAAAGAGALYLMFIGAVSSTILRKIPLDSCGCFGGGIHLTPSQALALDSVLLAACAFVWRARRTPAALDNWVEQGTL